MHESHHESIFCTFCIYYDASAATAAAAAAVSARARLRWPPGRRRGPGRPPGRGGRRLQAFSVERPRDGPGGPGGVRVTSHGTGHGHCEVPESDSGFQVRVTESRVRVAPGGRDSPARRRAPRLGPGVGLGPDSESNRDSAATVTVTVQGSGPSPINSDRHSGWQAASQSHGGKSKCTSIMRFHYYLYRLPSPAPDSAEMGTIRLLARSARYHSLRCPVPSSSGTPPTIRTMETGQGQESRWLSTQLNGG